MAEGDAEYWYVIYKAIADFGDVITEAAKARAAIDALGKSIDTQVNIEVNGLARAMAARQALAKAIKTHVDMETEGLAKSLAAIKAQSDALKTEAGDYDILASAAKRANVQTMFGGRSSMEQHLSDLQRELEYQILLNRQEWLGFTTPQQAYAWRQQEYNQRLLMNRAGWANYATADQYISYLQRETGAMSAENAVLMARGQRYRDLTGDYLAYYNAIKGKIANVGGVGANLSAVNDLNDALNNLPDTVETQVILDDSEAKTEMSKLLADLVALQQKKFDIQVGLDEAPLDAEIAAMQERIARIKDELHVEPVLTAGGGGIGGGGGGPPPPVAPGGAEEPNPGDAAAWEALARAENDAGDSATSAAAKLLALAATAKTGADAAKYAYAAQVALNTEQRAAADAAALDAIKLKAADDANKASIPGLVAASGGWFGLAGKLNLVGGVMGTVAVWHVVLDAVIEAVAILIPTIVTLVAGLGAFAVAGSDAFRAVYNRLVATHVAADALGHSIPPLTGQLEKLHQEVQPQVWQLYGDAINIVQQKTGLFNQLALKTGTVIDRLAGYLTSFAISASKGLSTFLRVGESDIAKFGEIFKNLGDALLSLIKVTQETHIDQFFLNFFVALSKVLELITKLPTPLLAVVIGLHGIYLWGGLAATVVLNLIGPLRSLAVASGGLAAADTALGSLAEDATPLQKLSAAIQDVGAGFAAIPGRARGVQTAEEMVAKSMGVGVTDVNAFKKAIEDSGMSVAQFAGRTESGAAKLEKYGAGLEGTRLRAVELGVAVGGSEDALAGLAGSAGEAAGTTGLLGGAMAALTAIPVAGWIAAGVVGVGALTFALLRMQDATQHWIVAMDAALNKTTTFQVVAQTVQDLAAVTGRLSLAQRDGIGNASELAAAQSDLSGKLSEELTHVGQISHAYGVNFVGALDLLHAAGVKTTAIFSDQSRVWDAARQQVAGLVEGYKAMGVGINEAQQAISVQLVTTSDQVKAMAQLNQAYDNFSTAVEAPINSFLAFDQALITFRSDASVAGAAMSGLGQTLKAISPGSTFSNAAINLQQQFQNVLSSVTAMFDALRNSNALGASTSFIKFVKDAVQVLIPLAGTNKAAAAEVSQLAQEAGGPATTNLQLLAKWAGHTKDPLDALYKASQQATEQTYNLSQDAKRLSDTLQQDLDPAMAKAAFNAYGGQQNFNDFANALVKTGPNSKATADAAGRLATELVAVTGNSANAKAEFVGFAEAMGLSKTQADKLWESAQKAAPGVQGLGTDSHNAGVKVNYLHSQLKQANQSLGDLQDNLGKRGTWGDIEHWFMSIGDDIGHFFGNLASMAAKGWNSWWASHGGELKQGWDTAWNNLVGGFRKDWDRFTSIFSGHGASGLLGQLQAAWTAFFNVIKVLGDSAVMNIKIAWDIFVGVINVSLDLITGHWKKAWKDMQQTAEQVWNAIKNFGIQVWNDVLDPAIQAAWHNLVLALWHLFDSSVVQPLSKFFLSTIPNWLGQVGGFFSSTWQSVWHAFDSHIVQPIAHFFTSTIPNWLGNVAQAWSSLWSQGWGFFNSHLISPVGKFFNSTIPGWLDSLSSAWTKLWNQGWSFFQNHLIQPMQRWFSSTLPNAISTGLRDGINAGIGFINKIIGFINNDVLAHLPGSLHIPTVGKVAHGGAIRMAASGSVPGTGDEDGTHIIAMGGEYMLRKSARMALDQAFGPNFLNSLNQADSWLGSGSRGNMASQRHIGAGNMYAAGGGIGGILGDVEGFLGGIGNDLTSGAKALAHLLGGGVSELKSLIGKGSEMVFNAIWDHTIQPMADAIPVTIPTAPMKLGVADVKTGVDKFLTSQDNKARASALGKGGLGRQSLRAIEDYWMGAGGPGGMVAHIAAAITGAESGFNPSAVQAGQPYATTGWGLWQITPGDSEPQFGINQALLNPHNNAGAAVAKYRGAGDNFTPWTTYVDGAYRAFMAAGGPVAMAAGEVITAIKQTTNNMALREAMALGSWLASRWSTTAKSNQGRYGPFAIDLAHVRGITKAKATNPAEAAHFMLPYYERAMRSVGNLDLRSPRTAIEAAAKSAEHMVTAWAEDPSMGTLTTGYNDMLSALGLRAGVQPGGPIQHTQHEKQLAAYQHALKVLQKSYDLEDAAEYAIYNAPHDRLKKKHPGHYRHLMSVLHKIRLDQRAIRQEYHHIAGLDGGALQVGDWRTLETDAQNLARYQNKEARFLSRYTGDVAKAQRALGLRHGLRGEIPRVERLWAELYNKSPWPGSGPHPGPRNVITPTGPVTVNLAPLVSGLGGPASPVFDVVPGLSQSATGMGFAAGGGLSDVAGMFATGGLVPFPTLNVMGLNSTLQRQLQAASMGQTSRTLSDAAGSRIGVQVGSMTINNPVAEKPSDSIARSSNRLAFLAGRGAV